MILIDSSFAVEWLAGTARAAAVALPSVPLAILPLQYAEVCAVFLRHHTELTAIIRELDAIELLHPDRVHLQQGAALYHRTRKKMRTTKISLADAILAAVALDHGARIATFDRDFLTLGFKGPMGIVSAV